MPPLSLSVTNNIEKSIRNASKFQYIINDKCSEIIEALRQISVRSGMAVYIWTSDLGLVNIKSRHTPLPATKSVLEALKYASNNHYFAVYVFPGISQKELLEIKSTLPSAGRFLNVSDNTRMLFLFNQDVQFNFMKNNGEKIELINQNAKKYKLRDNQWVPSND